MEDWEGEEEAERVGALLVVGRPLEGEGVRVGLKGELLGDLEGAPREGVGPEVTE